MPAIEDQIGRAGKIIKAVAVLLGLLPGIALLLGLVDIPPSLADLIKFLTFAVSIGVVICIMLLRDRIRRLTSKKAAILVVTAVLTGAAFATAYMIVAQDQIVVISTGAGIERYVKPLDPSADIQDIMRDYRGDYGEALATSVRNAELSALMEQESGSAIVLLILLLVAGQVLLVSGIVGGAWKLAGARQAKES
jgi:hypothetical protein